jgi:hypothetical protein
MGGSGALRKLARACSLLTQPESAAAHVRRLNGTSEDEIALSIVLIPVTRLQLLT